MLQFYFKQLSIIKAALGVFFLLHSLLLFGQDLPREKGFAVNAAPANQPKSTDELFVNGTGNDFDQYLSRSSRANGRLTYKVDITRYYSNLIEDNNPLPITKNGISQANAKELVERGLLPKTARLTLRVFDVDHNSQNDSNGDGVADPEIDYVYINGKQVEINKRKWTLKSGNDTWSTPSVEIPIEYLNLPTEPGKNGNLPNAENTIEIEVDATNVGWAIECDWISIEIKSPIRPLVLIRGFGPIGAFASTAAETWKTFGGFLKQDGIPFYIVESIDPCGPIFINGWRIRYEVQNVKTAFGVDKVNLIGHSTGGLNARAYLRTIPEAENLVQLGSPNHGTRKAYLWPFCQPAADQLQPNWIANNFNYFRKDIKNKLYQREKDSNVRIIHLIANDDFIIDPDENATLPWLANYKNNDVTSPTLLKSDGDFDIRHTELRTNHSVYTRLLKLIAPKISIKSKSNSQTPVSTELVKSKVPTDSLKTAYLWQGMLAPSANISKNIYLSSSQVGVFQVAFESASSTLSLQSPSGKIYNTSSKEYSKEDIFGGLITYNIANIEPGNWKLVLVNGKTSGNASIRTYIQTNKKLTVSTGSTSSFSLNTFIPVTAKFSQNNTPIIAAQLFAYFEQSSKKDSLELFDDGKHNDGNKNDGVYGNKLPGFSKPGSIALQIKAQKGLETLFEDVSLTIVPASASFANTYSETVQDTTADGFNDLLQAKVGIRIKQAGHYMVSALLRDSRDSVIDITSWTSLGGNPLTSGIQQVPLNFSGEAIGKNGKSGPFKLTDLTLTDLTYSIPLEHIKNPYSTQAYNINLFPRPPILLTGNNTETPVDSDQDGDFDFLDIKVQILVNRAGTYRLSAELIDSLQNSLNWTEGSAILKEGNNEITLRFDGQEINEKLINGRFNLTNFNLYNTSTIVDVSFYNVHRTKAYLFSQFNGNFITGIITDQVSKKPIVAATVIVSGTKLATAPTDSTGKFTIAGLPNGAYTLRVEKEDYCGSDTLQINLPQSKTPIELTLRSQRFTVSDKDTLFLPKGGSITLTGPNGWEKYLWSTNDTTKNLVVFKEGSYYLRVSTSNCQAVSDTVIVKQGFPPTADLDLRFGGSVADNLSEMIKTSDGGYLLGGSSASGINGDKTQNSQGGNDFWIVKTDSAGNKLWDQRFGGLGHDYLYSIVQTLDGGYLLGGSSLSPVSGNKTQGSRGGRDYWIVKVSVSGAKQWDKRFGGTGYDDLRKIIQLPSGEFIIAGYSDSPASGDKTQASWGGQDYWVLKLSRSGNKIWDARYGGYTDDILGWLVPTDDNGLILGGESDSDISGDKTQGNQGGKDFWVVKVDNDGTKVWDKRYGGFSDEYLNTIVPTVDGGYLLGGESKSGIGADKNSANQGSTDFWLVKINRNGIKQWDKGFGGTADEVLNSMMPVADGGYLLSGASASDNSGDKTQGNQGGRDFWIVKTDDNGTKQWDQRFGGTGNEEVRSVVEFSTGNFLLAGFTESDLGGDVSQPSRGGRDFWLVKAKENLPTVVQTENRFGGSNRDSYTSVLKTDDGGYLLGGYSASGMDGDKTQNNRGSNDFWIVKTDEHGAKQWDQRYGGTGNDVLNTVVSTLDGGYLLGGSSTSDRSGDKSQNSRGGEDYWIVKISSNGTKEWDRRFGGFGNDVLKELIQLSSGEYLLAGYSDSPIGGEKTQANQGGQDYWVLKLSNSGNTIWDKRFGGSLSDYLEELILTPDGNFLLGGYSASGMSGDRSQNSRGGYDYWLVKINGNGSKLWDKRFGGSLNDYMTSVVSTSDNNFMVGGFSVSSTSGDRTHANQGGDDYWLIKINSSGTKLWDQRFGGSSNDNLIKVVETNDGGYLLGGKSSSGIGGDKTQGSQGNSDFWIVKTDDKGVKQWDQRFGGKSVEELRTILKETDGSYTLGGFTESEISGDVAQYSRGGRDFWLVNVMPSELGVPAPKLAARVASKVSVQPGSKTEPHLLKLNVFPNPFQDLVTVNFSTPEEQTVMLKVYDSQGQEVRLLFNGMAEANKAYQIEWHPETYQANGLYIIQLYTKNRSMQQKIIKIR